MQRNAEIVLFTKLLIISINNKDSSTQLGSIKELTQFYANIMQKLCKIPKH